MVESSVECSRHTGPGINQGVTSSITDLESSKPPTNQQEVFFSENVPLDTTKKNTIRRKYIKKKTKRVKIGNEPKNNARD